jgi:hypothetical protein
MTNPYVFLICLGVFSTAVAAELLNPCVERSPFETLTEFDARCPPEQQTAPPLSEILRDLARQSGETDAQFRLRQNRLLEIFNRAAQRQDARYQAGSVTLSREAYDGAQFRLKPEWSAEFARFKLPVLLDLVIGRQEGLQLLREGAEKPLFIALQANPDGSLYAIPNLAGLNRLLALQAAPEPSKLEPPPVAQVPEQPRAERIPESEYTCSYDDEVNSVTAEGRTCAVGGIQVNTSAVSQIKARSEQLINRMTPLPACQDSIQRLHYLIAACNSSLDSWKRDMDTLGKISRGH